MEKANKIIMGFELHSMGLNQYAVGELLVLDVSNIIISEGASTMYTEIYIYSISLLIFLINNTHKTSSLIQVQELIN